MITEKMKQRAENTKKAVNESSVDSLMKETICENIDSSLNACNGLTMEEKIQANSENNFITSLLLSKLYVRMENNEQTTWKDTIIKCKWQIVIICLFITCLLVFRPEIAQVIGTTMVQ